MRELSAARAVALIDTEALAENYRALARYAAQTSGRTPRMIAVVKANAYGHGLTIAARALLRAGCDFFGVATLEEAIRLRKIAPSADILILGYTPPQRVAALASAHITQTVFSAAYAAALADGAAAEGVTVPVHIKLDCGMHRLGFSPSDTDAVFRAATRTGLLPTGIYTHFPVADSDTAATGRALALFLACHKALTARGLPLFAHAAASAAMLTLPNSILDGVRPGLAIYGICPVPTALPLTPALALLTRIVQIHKLPAGTPVGYGGAYVTSTAARIGTVPLGYGDGIPRRYSGQTVRIYHKNRAFSAPVVGRICMDQLMLDLSDTPAQTGDILQLYPDMPYAAKALDTIPYELLTALGPRIPRKELSHPCLPFTKNEQPT